MPIAHVLLANKTFTCCLYMTCQYVHANLRMAMPKTYPNRLWSLWGKWTHERARHGLEVDGNTHRRLVSSVGLNGCFVTSHVYL